jgi:hypothetical protein
VKRLLAAAAIAGSALVPLAPAHAVLYCDNLPVMAHCYTWSSGTARYCDLWVAPRCVVLA